MGEGGQNRERVRTITFYAALILLAYLLYVVTRPFLVPLATASVFVIFFYPWHARLERRYGSTPAAALSTLLVTTVLIVPAVLVLTAFVREATAGVASVREALAAGQFAWLDRAWAWLQRAAPLAGGVEPADLVNDLTGRVATVLASGAGGVLRDVGVFLFDLVVMIFATFFVFRDARAILGLVRRVLPFEDAYREQVIAQARDLIRASVASSLVVAMAQGTAGGVLFWLFGISAPVFWGVIMAFFSLLPIGAWIVWLPAAVWMIATGAVGKGLVFLALGAFGVSLIDNVLRPALLAGRAQMNGLVILVSLLGGIAAFGFIGLVIGPVILATATSLLAAYTEPPTESAGRAHH